MSKLVYEKHTISFNRIIPLHESEDILTLSVNAKEISEEAKLNPFCVNANCRDRNTKHPCYEPIIQSVSNPMLDPSVFSASFGIVSIGVISWKINLKEKTITFYLLPESKDSNGFYNNGIVDGQHRFWAIINALNIDPNKFITIQLLNSKKIDIIQYGIDLNNFKVRPQNAQDWFNKIYLPIEKIYLDLGYPESCYKIGKYSPYTRMVLLSMFSPLSKRLVRFSTIDVNVRKAKKYYIESMKIVNNKADYNENYAHWPKIMTNMDSFLKVICWLEKNAISCFEDASEIVITRRKAFDKDFLKNTLKKNGVPLFSIPDSNEDKKFYPSPYFLFFLITTIVQCFIVENDNKEYEFRHFDLFQRLFPTMLANGIQDILLDSFDSENKIRNITDFIRYINYSTLFKIQKKNNALLCANLVK